MSYYCDHGNQMRFAKTTEYVTANCTQVKILREYQPVIRWNP